MDLNREVHAYRTPRGFAGIECHLFRGMRFRGRCRLPAVAGTVSRAQILDAVAAELPDEHPVGESVFQGLATAVIGPDGDRDRMSWRTSRFRPAVSVVIPTRDRPTDLDNCLAAMARQDYDGDLEVLVVDNNPASGKTRPVVEKYSCCRYLSETKRGAASARNAGFAAANGEIIAITDDDVRVPPTWIRQLVEPFSREDIWMVTGSILPKSLEWDAERQFEDYGGFQFYSHAMDVGPHWFRGTQGIAPPVWQIGTSANMAFRRRIIHDEAIGPMREFLGPGTPCGAGEDLYFTYRLLKEGHTLHFDPSIWVYHCHRQDMEGFRKQAFNYGRSAIAYHLHIAIADGDFRGLRMVLWNIPLHHLQALTGFKHRTAGAYWPELAGQLSGYAAYFYSRWKDRRIERSRAD